MPRPAGQPAASCSSIPYLFHGTIRDNVFAGDPAAGDDRLAGPSALARVDELIGRLPDGADTVVGEAGSALSGGERQRVSIARALLKAAPMLLVDEATSALDTENEVAVVDALTADPQSRTRVIVAHRLASIRHADRVLFVDNGRVVEDGSVDELLAAGGRFERVLAPAARGRRLAHPGRLSHALTADSCRMPYS